MDWEAIETIIGSKASSADELLRAAEAVMEQWVVAKGEVPTHDKKEGFRLLALQRQGAVGDPSFNACRETCREAVYHFNLLQANAADSEKAAHTRLMMGLVVNHLLLFIRGKMEVAGLGEFCCASKPVRSMDVELPTSDARG